MLVLTRRVDQRIQIGKNVWIQVTKVNGQQVSLGIEAPRDTVILREEVALREQEAYKDVKAEK